MADVECRGCKKIKDSTFDFYWSGGERQRRCKQCMKEYIRAWHQRSRARIVAGKKKRDEQLASRTGKRNED